MTSEERRLSRLRRLERVRAIAKRQLAAETAEAEGVLAQLRELTERSRLLADDYTSREDALDGYALAQSGMFAAGLHHIVQNTGAEADHAQVQADRKMIELAAAERRRAAVEQRLELGLQTISKRGEHGAAGARRKIGTELE